MTPSAAYHKARALWPWPNHIAFASVIVEGKSYKIGYCLRGSSAPATVFYGNSWDECFEQAGAR